MADFVIRMLVIRSHSRRRSGCHFFSIYFRSDAISLNGKKVDVIFSCAAAFLYAFVSHSSYCLKSMLFWYFLLRQTFKWNKLNQARQEMNEINKQVSWHNRMLPTLWNYHKHINTPHTVFLLKATTKKIKIVQRKKISFKMEEKRMNSSKKSFVVRILLVETKSAHRLTMKACFCKAYAFCLLIPLSKCTEVSC